MLPDEAEAPAVGIGPAPASPDTQGDPAPFMVPGSDLAPSAPSQDGPEPDTAPAEAFDWTSVDLRRTKAEDVPEKYRPAFTKMQQQYKAAQADTSQRVEDLRRREQALETQQHRILSLQEQLSRPQTPAQQAKVRESFSDILQKPDLEQDTRAALSLFDGELQDRLEKAIGPLKALADRVPQLEQTIYQLTLKDRDAQVRNFALEVDEARAVYGDDVDAHAEKILRLRGLDRTLNQVAAPEINPVTRKPYTVSELTAIFNGTTAVVAQGARSEDASIRGAARSSARSAPATPGPSGTGKLSEAEARAEVRSIFPQIGR